MRHGGLVTNFGTLLGGGALFRLSPGTLVNSGVVLGNAAYGGVYMQAGGTVTNLAGGLISANGATSSYQGAPPYGVFIVGGAATITNAGTINGNTGNAVLLPTGFQNRVIVDPGAVFVGTVNGGTAVDATLELASSASVGTLSGFGTQIVNFGTVNFDSSASWLLHASTAISSAVINGFTTTDTIDLAGFVAVSDTFASNTLVLTSASNAHVTLHIQGALATSNFTIPGDGAGGTDLGFTAVVPTLNYGQTIDEAGIVATSETVSAGVMTLFNGGGTAVGTVAVGTSLASGDFSLRSDGSGGTDVIVDAIFGTYSSGVTLLTNPTTITSTGAINNHGTGPAIFGGSATVVNDGHITATSRTTVSLGVTTISAYSGVYLTDAGSFLDNSGTITGSLYAGQLTSGGSITNSGVMYGGKWGIESRGPISITNTGTISGGSQGIVLSGGGFISNSKLISGADGIGIGGGAGTVDNSGSILSYGAGVALNGGGAVSNSGAGLISVTGQYGAVYITGGAGSVSNAGTLDGYFGAQFTGTYNNTLVDSGTIIGRSGTAVAFGSGNDLLQFNPSTSIAISGVVDGGGGTNKLEFASGASAGTLSGIGLNFINFSIDTVDAGASWVLTGSNTIAAGVTLTNSGTLTDAGTLTNAGIISASSGNGIRLEAGGIVTNQSSGTISGYNGITSAGGGTVVNAGTIIGSHYAVNFAAGFANRLVVDPNSALTGGAYGGGGVLELASASSAGTLSGLGVSITNFGTLQFDTGAQWTIAGNASANGLGTLGISGFTIGDTIDLAGFVAVSKTFASNTLVLTDAGNAHVTLHIQGALTTSNFTLGGDGAGGTDLGFTTVAAALNYGQTIDEAGIVATSETVSAGTLTLFNAGGTAVGEVAVGTSLASGDFALRSDGSGGTDVIVDTVFGTYSGGVTLLTNPTTIAATGHVSNTVNNGKAVSGPTGINWTLTNQGLVSETASGGIGIGFAQSGTVINASGGRITAAGDGVLLNGGGVATNASGGTITGAVGVDAKSAVATVINAGSIGATGSGAGVQLEDGGQVTNQSGGIITGYAGVIALGAAATVMNAGSIGANLTAGNAISVWLQSGGTVTNLSGGVIAGNYGVAFTAVAATLVNAGTIAGNATNSVAGGRVLRWRRRSGHQPVRWRDHRVPGCPGGRMPR